MTRRVTPVQTLPCEGAFAAMADVTTPIFSLAGSQLDTGQRKAKAAVVWSDRNKFRALVTPSMFVGGFGDSDAGSGRKR